MADTKANQRRDAIRMLTIGVGLILFGAVGLAVPFLTVTTAQDWDRLNEEVEAFARQSSVSTDFTPTAKPVEDTVHRDIADRLIIPKIKVDMPLTRGTDADALLKGGWLWPTTAAPGSEGNAVVFGHRFRYLPPVSNTFYHLDELQAGDAFLVRYGGEEFTYRVIGTSVIEPDNFSVLNAEPGTKRMTLITCAPAFSTKYRLVVIGELVEP